MLVDLDAHLVGSLMQVKIWYSWWVLSSLVIIDRVHWIGKEKLVKFVLDCQVRLP